MRACNNPHEMIRKRRLGRTRLDVSELALGTVELGMAYGIHAERPSEKGASALLHHALDAGINLLDTARAYGDAEAIIGRNLAGRRKEYVLLSKVPVGTAEAVESAVNQSLIQLRTECIDVMLVHCGYDATPDQDTVDALVNCRSAGKLRFLGASVYGESAALACINEDWCECVEIAYSMLDRRPERTTLQKAADHDTGVIARSVLLKGSLTPRCSSLPDEFKPLKSAVAQVVEAARSAMSELPDHAYRYVLNHPAVASALVGTSSIHELDVAVAATNVTIDADFVGRLRKLPPLSEEWLNPGRWPRVNGIC